MEKLFRKTIFTFTFLMSFFIFSGEINAEDMKCTYKDNNGDKITLNLGDYTQEIIDSLDIKIEGSTSAESYTIYGFKGGSSADYGIPISFELGDGCPDYFDKYSGDTIKLVPKGGAKPSTSKIGTYSLIAVDLFENSDIFWGNANYNAGSTTDPYDRQFGEIIGTDKGYQCSYEFDKIGTVVVFVGTNGSVSAISPKDKQIRFMNKDYFLNEIATNKKCPVTLCYNWIFVSADELTFQSNSTCPSNTHANTNQTELADTSFDILSERELIETKNQLKATDQSMKDLGACYTTLDTSNICKDERNAFVSSQNKWLGSSYSAISIPGTYDEMRGPFDDYNACISRNYSDSQITAKCNTEAEEFNNQVTTLEGMDNVLVSYNLSGATGGSLFGRYGMTDLNCEDILGDSLLDLFKSIFKYAQVGAIVVSVVLSMLDYAKAVMADDADALKKANKKLRTRIIVLVVLFLLPLLIEFILDTFDVGVVENKNPFCK